MKANVRLSKGQIQSIQVVIDSWRDAMGQAGTSAYREECAALPGIEKELSRVLATIDAEADAQDKVEYIADTLEAAYRHAKGDDEGVVPFPTLAAKQPYLVNLWRLKAAVCKSTGLRISDAQLEAAIGLLEKKYRMKVLCEFCGADKPIRFRDENVTALRFTPKV